MKKLNYQGLAKDGSDCNGAYISLQVSAKCECCKKELAIGDEAVATSFGGYNDPVYGFMCIGCIEGSEQEYQNALLDAEIYQDQCWGY